MANCNYFASSGGKDERALKVAFIVSIRGAERERQVKVQNARRAPPHPINRNYRNQHISVRPAKMSNNQSLACPDGYGPDLLYRFPTEPFFVEPYGMDCYLSYTGYTVLGVIIIASSAICLCLFLTTLSKRDNKHIRLVKIVHLVTTVNTALAVAIGWSLPRLFHFFYLYTMVWFIITALILAHMGYGSIAQTIRRVEMQVTVVS